MSIVNPGISAFFHEVLTYNDGNDFYTHEVKVGSSLKGLSFDDVLVLLREHQVLLLSIIVNEEYQDPHLPGSSMKLRQRVLTNPEKYEVCEGDRIFVLCHDEESLRRAIEDIESSKLRDTFSNRLKRIKQMLSKN